MAITVTVNESPTFVTVNETNNEVILNQSDNPITVTTTLDLIAANADQINVGAIGNIIPAGTVANALEVLADQFFRGPSAPSGDNLEEGDLWYDTDDNQLKYIERLHLTHLNSYLLLRQQAQWTISMAGCFRT